MNDRSDDMRVRDAMTPDPQTIDGMAPVREALTVMRKRNISCLVVDRRDSEDEYGLVLVTDVAREVLGTGRPVARTQVYEVMQKPAPAVDSAMQLKYAIRHMTRFGLSHCVVLEGRTIAGIVSLRDIAMRLLDAND